MTLAGSFVHCTSLPSSSVIAFHMSFLSQDSLVLLSFFVPLGVCLFIFISPLLFSFLGLSRPVQCFFFMLPEAPDRLFPFSRLSCFFV